MLRSKLTIAMMASALVVSATAAQAQEELTLCWAAWDPANALTELSKDFTAESGIKMNYEFVPWTSFADRFLNELNSGGKLCDLLIGDNQWLGGAATYGHYLGQGGTPARAITVEHLGAETVALLEVAGGELHVLLAASDRLTPGEQTTVRASPGAAIFFDAAGTRLPWDSGFAPVAHRESAYGP